MHTYIIIAFNSPIKIIQDNHTGKQVYPPEPTKTQVKIYFDIIPKYLQKAEYTFVLQYYLETVFDIKTVRAIIIPTSEELFYYIVYVTYTYPQTHRISLHHIIMTHVYIIQIPFYTSYCLYPPTNTHHLPIQIRSYNSVVERHINNIIINVYKSLTVCVCMDKIITLVQFLPRLPTSHTCHIVGCFFFFIQISASYFSASMFCLPCNSCVYWLVVVKNMFLYIRKIIIIITRY